MEKLRKVLVIDDMEAMRDLVITTLKQMYQAEFLEAADGEKAWQLLVEEGAKGTPVQFIVCDWRMPRMDGIAFLKKLRAHPVYRNTPFLFLTAETFQEQVQEAISSGADHFLVKPFQAVDMKNRVEFILNKKRSA
jgi:two-component system chemotaxis response regulator CheY